MTPKQRRELALELGVASVGVVALVVSVLACGQSDGVEGRW